VLAATLVAVVVMVGGLGGGMLGHLAGGGFSDPKTQSDRGTTRLEEILDAGDPNLLVVVTTKAGSVDDPVVAAAGAALTEEPAPEPSVQQAPCSWTLGSAPRVRSHDRDQA
jgi:putative drug exporter of the RND superfamily